MAELFEDCMFVVSRHTDTIKQHSAKSCAKLKREADQWKRTVNCFPTFEDAKTFLIDRARTRIDQAAAEIRSAERDLVKARNRLTKCKALEQRGNATWKRVKPNSSRPVPSSDNWSRFASRRGKREHEGKDAAEGVCFAR